MTFPLRTKLRILSTLATLLSASAFSATLSFSTPAQIADRLPAYSRPHVAGDFNNDGKLDIACTESLNDNVFVVLGGAQFNFSTAALVGQSDSPITVASGDFNKDGFLDLICLKSGDFTMLYGSGDGTFGVGSSYALAGADWIAVGNFDEDAGGNLDLAVTNGTSTLSIFLGNGNGTFRAPSSLTTGTDPGQVVVADFNNDGHTDLAVVNTGSNTIGVYLGSGTGTFAPAVTYAVDSGTYSLAAADFNRD
ncbi:MAG TPA: VCBS repeat-containing protein, partial [Planctomycetota bacterium]|nr:VCBS repeat-containing protein [Planctomycetota bacterium]